ncbi:unnamed protein product [Rotaria magnacalcarata]
MLFNACAKLCNSQAIKLGKDKFKRLPTFFLQDQRLVNSAIDMLMKFDDASQAETTTPKQDLLNELPTKHHLYSGIWPSSGRRQASCRYASNVRVRWDEAGCVMDKTVTAAEIVTLN